MASGKAPTSSRTSCLKAPDHVPVCFLFNKAGWRQLLCVGSVRSWSSKMRARTQFESGGTRQSSEPGCSCVRWGSQGELPGREHSPALQEGRKLPREAPGVPRSHGRSQASEGKAPFLPWLRACLCILFSHCMRIPRPARHGCPPASPPASAWPGARSLRNVGTQPRLEAGGQVTQRGHVGRALAQGFEQTLQKWQDAWT